MLQPGYPQDISMFGNGMPAQSIETAVWWEDVAKTYFFKGDRYVHGLCVCVCVCVCVTFSTYLYAGIGDITKT